MRRGARYLKAFYWKAYHDNLTGLGGMVAYNLLLSILPLALIALFVAGQVVQSGELEHTVVRDLRRVFPGAAESTLTNALHRIEGSTTRLGVAALITSVWIGSSFWGALDTAFCRIYHFECRTWLQQKRFALIMLVVVLLFMAATVAVPALQSVLVEGTEQLPFGLARVRGLVFGLSLAGGLGLLFGMLCLIYTTVPNRRVPWRAIWPGAAVATVSIGAVDYAFPFYLSKVSTIARLGTTLVFVLIVLLWFYALAMIMLGGAVVNAMRLERSVASDGAAPAPSANPSETRPDSAPA